MKAKQMSLVMPGLPEKYRYELEMLIREFLPSAVFSDEHPDLKLQIDEDQVCLTAGDSVNVKAIDRHFQLSSDPLKDGLKRACYELLSDYTGMHLPWGILTGVRPTKIALSAFDKGLTQEQILSIMQEEYQLDAEKACLMIETAQKERELLSDHAGEDISIYVGIPFCPTRCAYCSFVSYDYSTYQTLSDRYIDALIREIQETAPYLADRKRHSFYMGGGTPTVLSAEQLDRLLGEIFRTFDQNSFREITVEAGRPDTITLEKLKVLKNHGVARISINPQSLNQKTLDLVGRRHTVEQVYEAYRMARDVGFDAINMDFILGLTGEGTEEVLSSMDQVLTLRPDNLTVHTLAIKRSSALHQDGGDALLHEQGPLLAKMIPITRETAEKLGMKPYYLYRQKNMAGNFENVGYSLPGKECLYNIEIMEERQSILAFGAGGVSKLYNPAINRLVRAANVKNVTEYMDRTPEMVHRKQKALMESTEQRKGDSDEPSAS